MPSHKIGRRIFFKGEILEYFLKYRVVSFKEALDFLKLSASALENWIGYNRYPELRSIKIGKHRRFLMEDLAFVMARREKIAMKAENTKKY
jgi:hypothetical protein